MVRLNCANPKCNNTVCRPPNHFNRYKHAFCCKECYYQWRRGRKYIYEGNRISPLRRLKLCAEIRKEMHEPGNDDDSSDRRLHSVWYDGRDDTREVGLSVKRSKH